MSLATRYPSFFSMPFLVVFPKILRQKGISDRRDGKGIRLRWPAKIVDNGLYSDRSPRFDVFELQARNCKSALRDTTQSLPNSFVAILVVVALLLSAGCASIGPETVSRDRFDYNGEVARSWKEQTLLNIVKIRYLDVPVFLDVAQIVSGYTLQSTVSLGGAAGPTGNSVSLGAQGLWTDRPTITYTPLTGAQFNRNMMTPLTPSAVLFTIEAGWRADMVLRLSVSSINGISSSGPDAARFDRIVLIVRALQQAQALGMRVQPEGPEQQAIVLFFRARALTQEQESLLRELREILGLDPNRSDFTVTFGSAQATPGEIAIATRSVLQMLLALAAYVDVPEKDLQEGRASPGMRIERPEMGQLSVRYSRERPSDALVSVALRGGWFWIDDRDLVSKNTFAVLMLLTTLTETGAREALPLVTIPAG
jgi:hypothetical protein